MKKIKVAISQRIIPHYRIPVFKEFSNRNNIDLTVFYGKGMRSGSQVNGFNISGFKHKKLFTIKLNYVGIYGNPQLRVLHPFLFFYLIVGRFDVVIVEPSTNIYNNLFNLLYCKLFNAKLIWHESGSLPKNERSKFRRLIDPFVSLMIRNSDAFLTYTSYADYSLKRDFSISDNKIFRAQNTIDITELKNNIPRFESQIMRKKKDIDIEGFKVALYIGGIEKRKKINNLIEAVELCNKKGLKIKCLIVGDGPDKKELYDNLTAIQRKLVVFAGKQVEQAVLYVLCSDVVVLPSSGGLSVMTSFACGKPFIGSEEIEHGGIKDYVNHGENGFLVKENNVQDLTEKLLDLFLDNKKYIEMAKNAKLTSTKITVENMVNGFENAVNFVYA